MSERIEQSYDMLEKACVKLTEYVENDDGSEQHMLAIIHSFEYTFELWWKYLQRYMEDKVTLEQYGPNATIKNAFTYHIIENGQVWMDMLKDRNLTTHTYNINIAMEIKERVKTIYVFEFNKFLKEMKG